MINEYIILTSSIFWSFISIWGLKVLFPNFYQNISNLNRILFEVVLTFMFYIVYLSIQGMIFEFILIKPGYISVNTGTAGGYFWEGKPGCDNCFEKHNFYKNIFKYFWVGGGLLILSFSLFKYQWKSFFQPKQINKSTLNILMTIILATLTLGLVLVTLLSFIMGEPGWESYDKELIYSF